MDDVLRGLPEKDPAPQSYAQQPQTGGNIELRSMNTNLGAVRVGVPRNMALVVTRISQAAQQFGQKWQYAIPFKDRKRNKTTLVTGPTIGCALDVARCYGNCTVDVEKVEEVGQSWVFHAVFLDIETGFRLGRPFRQR